MCTIILYSLVTQTTYLVGTQIHSICIFIVIDSAIFLDPLWLILDDNDGTYGTYTRKYL